MKPVLSAVPFVFLPCRGERCHDSASRYRAGWNPPVGGPVPAKLSVKDKTGRTIDLTKDQVDGGIRVTVPAAKRQGVDTVIVLKLLGTK
jgi:hypothetical protein